jgi:hypothetical protein
VRFAYDQLADILRPMRNDPTEVFRGLIAHEEVEAQAVEESCMTILRFEAEGEEERFQSSLAGLIAVLDEFSGSLTPGESDVRGQIHFFWDILEPTLRCAVGVAQALPRARAATIERLYRGVTAFRGFSAGHVDLLSFETLGHWLGEAPLPAALRARLVLDVTPWDRAWPWRFMDWMSYRPHFESAVDDRSSGRAGAVLNRLLQEDTNGVRPILVAALGDMTKIQCAPRDHDAGVSGVSAYETEGAG